MSYQKGFNYLASLGVDTTSIMSNYVSKSRNREPINSFDGEMYDTIKERLMQVDQELAEQVEIACHDERITKNFCDTSKLYEQAVRFTAQETFTKSMLGNVNYEGAKSLLKEMLPKLNAPLIPLELSASTDISKIFSNPEASSGILAYPMHKSEAEDLIKQVALHIIEEYDERFSLPAIALTRSQITDYIVDGKVDASNIKYKTRLVMCVDAASVLVEQIYGQPLLDNVFKHLSQYAGGVDDGQICKFLTQYCRQKNWISIDYSKFDASIQGWLIKDAFNILSEYYGPEHGKAFSWIAHNFIHMQLLMPNGQMLDLHKGIKSGSYFTQMVGSMCNLLMILTFMCAEYGHPDGDLKNLNLERVRTQLRSPVSSHPHHFTMMAMGDDNIIFTYDKLDVKSLSTYLYHNFRATITLEGEKGFKSGGPDDAPSFLKREWKVSGQERDELEMWVNLLHPEYRRSYEGFSPSHILYGYYLTFEGSMRKYFKRDELMSMMSEADGGFQALARIKLNDLPGSLRFQVLSRGINRDNWAAKLERDYKRNQS